MRKIKEAIRDERLYDYIAETMPESDEKELLLSLIFETSENTLKYVIIDDIESRQEIDHYEITENDETTAVLQDEKTANETYKNRLKEKNGRFVQLFACFDDDGLDRKELKWDFQEEEE